MPTTRFRRLLRTVRAAWFRWSAEQDRAYHDWLFTEQQFDPFCASYPGNITIRRFADLSEPYLTDSAQVLDLGCGTGEITCELARRFPDTGFIGIDHSQAGIDRATGHAEALGLNNVTFSVGDVERIESADAVDLVMMFNAFHHLADPKMFVRRMGQFCRRFVLVEPNADWKGSWIQELDCDWLLHDLDNIRAHIAYIVGEREPPVPSNIRNQQVGEPVEHRYTVDDLERFFEGYGLEVRGTVAGLDCYPPSPSLDTPDCTRFGQLAYELYAEVDERLRDQNLDLLAKHVVIYAEHGREVERRVPPDQPDTVNWTSCLRGPYDVRYLGYDGPSEAKSDAVIFAEVKFRNDSWRQLSSARAATPDFLSYHWLDQRGFVVHLDGIRSPLPRVVAPGNEVEMAFKLRTPERPGRYILAIDLVREHTTWYSDAGSPCLRVSFRVR